MNERPVDIVVIGSGVIGNAIAYFLGRDTDLSIVSVGVKKAGTASLASAGGLWPIGESVGLGCGVIFSKMLSQKREDADLTASLPHNLPRFFLDFCMRSNAMFPLLSEELKELTGVDCKLERSGLKFLMYNESDREYARKIYDSVPHLSGLLTWLNEAELRSEEPNVTTEAIGALAFLKDDQVNPYLLTEAYQRGAQAHGVRFLENTEVTGIGVESNRVVSVRTAEGTIPCNTLINAAGAWAGQIGKMVELNIPVTPIKGQIVLSEKLPQFLRSCLSTSDCYIAQKDHGELLIGSTTEEKGFDTSSTLNEIRNLCQGATRAIPALRNLHIKRTWAGLRPGTPDEIPILGAVSELHGYINACGHFRTGILTSAVTAEMIVSAVTNRPFSVPIEPFLMNRFGRYPARGGEKNQFWGA